MAAVLLIRTFHVGKKKPISLIFKRNHLRIVVQGTTKNEDREMKSPNQIQAEDNRMQLQGIMTARKLQEMHSQFYSPLEKNPETKTWFKLLNAS